MNIKPFLLSAIIFATPVTAKADVFGAVFGAINNFLTQVSNGQFSQSEGRPDTGTANAQQFLQMADNLEKQLAENRDNYSLSGATRIQRDIDIYREIGGYLGELHDGAPPASPQKSSEPSAELKKAKKREASAERNLGKKQKLLHRDTRLAVKYGNNKMIKNADESAERAKKARKNHRKKARAVKAAANR